MVFTVENGIFTLDVVINHDFSAFQANEYDVIEEASTYYSGFFCSSQIYF